MLEKFEKKNKNFRHSTTLKGHGSSLNKEFTNHMAHFLVYNVLAKFQLFCIITCRDILYWCFDKPDDVISI